MWRIALGTIVGIVTAVPTAAFRLLAEVRGLTARPF